jgi:XTP/dITP diphosphohydrolase
MILHAATSNRDKLRELLMARDQAGITTLEIVALPGLRSIAPPSEDGATYEENAAKKALYYSGYTREIVLAEDSGLEVEALAGAPGVRSARYAGDQSTDEANNDLVRQALAGETNRRGRFVSAVALAQEGRLIRTDRGEVSGLILSEPRGNQGFGYDPLFFYEPFQCSFGEVAAERKFEVSHRGNALRSLFRNWPAAANLGP